MIVLALVVLLAGLSLAYMSRTTSDRQLAKSSYNDTSADLLARSALDLVERLHPDIAFSDLMLPDLNGLEVTRRALRASPNTRVVILSMYSDEPHVLEALQAGAMAYMLKGTSAESLLFGLQELLAGRN